MLVSDAPPLSQAEIDKAIRALTAAEKTAIMKIAGFYAKVTHYETRDLVQEAYCRVLDGRRVWPRELAATLF
jgi:hypothetical protein